MNSSTMGRFPAKLFWGLGKNEQLKINWATSFKTYSHYENEYLLKRDSWLSTKRWGLYWWNQVKFWRRLSPDRYCHWKLLIFIGNQEIWIYFEYILTGAWERCAIFTIGRWRQQRDESCFIEFLTRFFEFFFRLIQKTYFFYSGLQSKLASHYNDKQTFSVNFIKKLLNFSQVNAYNSLWTVSSSVRLAPFYRSLIDSSNGRLKIWKSFVMTSSSRWSSITLTPKLSEKHVRKSVRQDSMHFSYFFE